MPNPDRVALTAMAGTGTEPTGTNGHSKEAHRLAAIADMPDFESDEAPADPGPEKTAPAEVKAEPAKEPEKAADPADAQLSALKKRDARQREQFNAERAEFDKQKAELAAKLERLEKLEALADADFDAIVEAVRGKPVTEEEAGIQSRRLYAKTSKGKDDPRLRATADQLAKEKATTDRVSTVEKTLLAKIEALESKLTAKEQAEQRDAFKTTFLGHVTKAVGDAHPITKAELEADKDAATEGLAKAKAELWERDDEEPDWPDVVAHYEKTMGEFYAKRGFTRGTPKPAEKVETKKTEPSKSLTADMAAGTKAPDGRKKTREELREQNIRDMPDFDD